MFTYGDGVGGRGGWGIERRGWGVGEAKRREEGRAQRLFLIHEIAQRSLWF